MNKRTCAPHFSVTFLSWNWKFRACFQAVIAIDHVRGFFKIDSVKAPETAGSSWKLAYKSFTKWTVLLPYLHPTVLFKQCSTLSWGIGHKPQFVLLHYFDILLSFILEGYLEGEFENYVLILMRLYSWLYYEKLIIWLNKESKCILIFQALFHVQDERVTGCSALMKLSV